MIRAALSTPAASRAIPAGAAFLAASALSAYARVPRDEPKATTADASRPAVRAAPGATEPPPAAARPTSPDIVGTIIAAPPWVARGTPQDRERALTCLTTAIYYEAATEPDAGQAAVAQVILNRARHPAFAPTVCGVIYQGSERPGCQFTFACDGALARVPGRRWWNRARTAAARALAGSVFAPVGLATHYHSYAATPAWNRSLVLTGMFGAHLFHRWSGDWGTVLAFTRRYTGGETLPGPHLPEVPVLAVVLPPTPPVIARPLAPQPTPPPDRPPALSQENPSAPTMSTQDDRSTVLERWRDAGQPLRD